MGPGSGGAFGRQVHAPQDEGNDHERPKDVPVPHHARVDGGQAQQEPPCQGQQAQKGGRAAPGEEDVNDEGPEPGEARQRDQPFPVVRAGPDKRAVRAGGGEIPPHGFCGKRQVHQQVQEQSRVNGNHQRSPLGGRAHGQEQERGNQQEGCQLQHAHPGGKERACFRIAVRALGDGGEDGPVQEQQEDAAVSDGAAHGAFFIRRKAQPCSGVRLIGGVRHGGYRRLL